MAYSLTSRGGDLLQAESWTAESGGVHTFPTFLATSSSSCIPAQGMIESNPAFGHVETWAITVERRPRPGYNRGGSNFETALMIPSLPSEDYYGNLCAGDGGQYYKVRLDGYQAIYLSGFVEGGGTHFWIGIYNADREHLASFGHFEHGDYSAGLFINPNPTAADFFIKLDCSFNNVSRFRMSVKLPQKVALGASVSSTSNPGYFKVYIPTKWGGRLNVTAPGAQIVQLNYPAGNSYANGEETGEDKHGWYTFRVEGSSNYTVSTAFTQAGEATRRPWNFYFWSALGNHIWVPDNCTSNCRCESRAEGDDIQVIGYQTIVNPGTVVVESARTGSNPGVLRSTAGGGNRVRNMHNLFSPSGEYQPLAKYDARHSTSARDWEARNHRAIAQWDGHCLGVAIASLALNKPEGAGYAGPELEALWGELGEHPEHEFDDGGISSVLPGPPLPGFDSTDVWAPRVHGLLEQWVKSRTEALYANLRAQPSTSGPQPTAEEVWNHGVYKFSARFEEAPGGNERVVKITNTIYANDDRPLPPPDPDISDRIVIYQYVVTYLAGVLDLSPEGQNDWISVSGQAVYALKSLRHLYAPKWEACTWQPPTSSCARNPHVTLGRVAADDERN